MFRDSCVNGCRPDSWSEDRRIGSLLGDVKFFFETPIFLILRLVTNIDLVANRIRVGVENFPIALSDRQFVRSECHLFGVGNGSKACCRKQALGLLGTGTARGYGQKCESAEDPFHAFPFRCAAPAVAPNSFRIGPQITSSSLPGDQRPTWNAKP
jgi:hypothetical protein